MSFHRPLHGSDGDGCVGNDAGADDQLNANAGLPVLLEGPDGPHGHVPGFHDPAPPHALCLVPGLAEGSGSLENQAGPAGHSGGTAAECSTAVPALQLLSDSRV